MPTSRRACSYLLTVASVLGWRRYRARGWVNSVSNLPNLNALRANHGARDQAVVAARILNYEEIVATLPPNSERQLVEQIVARLKVGSPNRILYQGDAGIFAWFEEARAAIRQPPRSALCLVSQPGARRWQVDGPGDLLRRRGRQRPVDCQPPGQRAGGRRRGRARRPEMEVSRPGDASKTPRGSSRCSASSTKRSIVARSGSPISPSWSLRPGASSAPRRSRAGPTRRKGRSPHRNSLPRPSRAIASAS